MKYDFERYSVSELQAINFTLTVLAVNLIESTKTKTQILKHIEQVTKELEQVANDKLTQMEAQ